MPSSSGSDFRFNNALGKIKTHLLASSWECIGDTDSGETEYTGLEYQAGTGTGARTIYFRCPGYDDLAEAFFAVYSLNSGSAYFTIAVKGMNEYIEGYSLTGTLSGQPYASAGCFLPCSNTDASYYITGDERKFTLLVNVAGRPQMLGAGLLLASGPTTEYPKPMYVGGSIGVSTVLSGAATASNGNKGFFSPGSSTNCTLNIYTPEGVWTGVDNYGSNDVIETSATAASTSVPITIPYVSKYHYTGQFDARAWNSSNIATFPIDIYQRRASPLYNDHYGEFDGIYWISGGADTPLAVEDVITIDTVDYIVWHHPILSDFNDFCAVKMYP